MWWHTLIILALRRLRQEHHEFEVSKFKGSLSYRVRPCLKIKTLIIIIIIIIIVVFPLF
jgi:hypothetical protein